MSDRNPTDDNYWDPKSTLTDGYITLPELLGKDDQGQRIKVALKNLDITKDGFSLGGATVSLPDFTVNLLGLPSLKAIGTGIKLEYAKDPNKTVTDKNGNTVAEESFKIQGQLVLPNFYNLTANFSGSNYIKISNNSTNSLEVVGTFSASNINIATGWTIKYAELGIDTTNKRVTAKGTLAIPSGVEIGADVTFDNGVLTYADIKADHLNKPIATTGAYLQTIEGRYEGNTSKFSGDLDVTAGPQVDISLPDWLGGGFYGSVIDLHVHGEITTDYLKGSGNLKILGGLIQGNASAELNWTQQYFLANANFDILYGAITTTTDLLAYKNASNQYGVYMFGEAKVSIPRNLPWIGGYELASGEVYFQYTDNGISSDDYVAAWGTVSVLGTVGIKVDFDGNYNVIWKNDADAIATQAKAVFTDFNNKTNIPDYSQPISNLGNSLSSNPVTTTGTDNNDYLQGDYKANTIDGLKGDDQIFGQEGNDTLYGNVGNDFLDGGAYSDKLYGGAGDDYLYGGAFNWGLVTSGELKQVANDYGSFGVNDGSGGGYVVYDADTLDGGDGIDTANYKSHPILTSIYYNIIADLSKNTITGQYFPKQVVTTLISIENIIGSDGNDQITGDAGNNRLEGENGDDQINGGAGHDTLEGDSGNDKLNGGDGNDILNGGNGNDTLSGGTGNDTLKGGDGYDIATYTGLYTEYQTTILSDGSIQVKDTNISNGDEGTDILTGIEQINFVYPGTDSVVTGTANSDTLNAGTYWSLIFGGDGNDILNGGNGNDALSGGTGNDTLKGGAGNDIATYTGLYIEYQTTILSDGSIQVKDTNISNGDEGTDILTGIEQINFKGDGSGGIYSAIAGTANSETLNAGSYSSLIFGGGGNDVLNGGDGNDTLNGGDGNDSISGGTGRDILIGGAGNDTIYGGSGIDTVDYSTSISGVNVTLGWGNTIVNDGFGNQDTLYEIENLTGSNYNDTLNGESAYSWNNVINGGDGNDSISGNGGDDTLIGGAGNDTLNGGTGNDIATYTGLYAEYQTTILSDGSIQVKDTVTGNGDEGTDILTGIEQINFVYPGIDSVVTGTADSETLNAGTYWSLIFGGDGNDVLNGRDGNDTLNGGNGNDTLNGGNGYDTVVFTGNSNEYKFNFDTLGRLTITDQIANRDGVDTVTQSEEIKFADRSYNSSDFNEDFYRKVHPDVDQAAKNNTYGYTTGLGHYLKYGMNEGRVTNFNFDEKYYLSQNQDVAQAAANNTYGYTTGLGHYLKYGINDGRLAKYNVLNSNDPLMGTPYAEILEGADGNNILYGKAGNDALNGGAGNDTLTGGAGKDSLTGGAGVDRFDYRNLPDSLLNNFDVITDFNANSGNDLFLVTTARSGFSNAGSVATLDTSGIQAKLNNTNFAANYAAQFTFGSRTFVAINDATAGFNTTTDAIIEVTGLTGTLGTGNFTTTLA